MVSSVEQIGEEVRATGLVSGRWTRSDFALLTTASVALAICCVLTSAKKFFWYDEVNSANLVADPSLSHMIGTIAAGGESAPPLYHMLLWLWARVAGQSELALRAPSCAMMIVALVLVWVTLRRRYSLQATAVGVLVTFPLSALVLYHVAEARFYGFLTALVALATYLYARAILAPERLSWKLLAAIAATHAALIYTHVYGAMYSAAILVAWVVADRCAGRWRPANYAAIVAGWATFIPWVPSLRRAADLAHPRGWITAPTPGALIEVFGVAMRRLPVVVIGFVLLSALGGFFATTRGPTVGRVANAARRQRVVAAIGVALGAAAITWLPFRFIHPNVPASDLLKQSSGLLMLAILLAVLVSVIVRAGGFRAAAREEPLLVVATAIVCVPFAAFLLSRAVIPIFVDRYLLPSAVGISIILAQGMELTTAAFDEREATASPTPLSRPFRAAWTSVFALLAVYPIWAGYSTNPGERPGLRLEKAVPPHAVVIVPSLLNFITILHYQERPDIEYVFPMDRAAYLDPRAPRSAIYGYNFLQVIEARGYLSASPRDASSPLCSYSGLVIAHMANNGWPMIRIESDSGLATEALERPGAPSDSAVAYLVHERRPAEQRPCIQGVERPTRS